MEKGYNFYFIIILKPSNFIKKTTNSSNFNKINNLTRKKEQLLKIIKNKKFLKIIQLIRKKDH